MTVISGPGELVALVPHLLGFEPRDSVVTVLVGLGGGITSAMRVDRGDLLAPDGPELALEIAAQAARDGAARAMVLAFGEGRASRGCAALDLVADALSDTVGEVGRWQVASGRYFCPDCTDPRCCPPEGRAIPRVTGAVMGPRWRDARGLDLRGAPPSERRKGTRAASRWETRARSMDPARWRRESLAAWETAVAREGLGIGAAGMGRIAACLGDVRVRDAALLTLIPDATQAVLDAVDGRDTAAVAAALDIGLRPASPPDPARTAAAEDVLSEVLDILTGSRAAPAAAMLGVIAWWTGDRDRAIAWSEVALGLDPRYRLATLVLALVETADSR